MDQQIRRLERLKNEDPVAWLRGMKRANKIGPMNLEVLGMLGYVPAVIVLGGHEPIDEKWTYYFRGTWFTDAKVRAPRSWWYQAGTETYRPNIHRLNFFIQQIGWMRKHLILLVKDDEPSELRRWLIPLINRQVLRTVLVNDL